MDEKGEVRGEIRMDGFAEYFYAKEEGLELEPLRVRRGAVISYSDVLYNVDYTEKIKPMQAVAPAVMTRRK